MHKFLQMLFVFLCLALHVIRWYQMKISDLWICTEANVCYLQLISEKLFVKRLSKKSVRTAGYIDHTCRCQSYASASTNSLSFKVHVQLYGCNLSSAIVYLILSFIKTTFFIPSSSALHIPASYNLFSCLSVFGSFLTNKNTFSIPDPFT